MAFVQAQEFQLAGSGCSATATSIVITGFTLPDGTKITQAMFGTTGYGTLEPGTSREESISFTGITDNSDGTQTITGVTRGLKFQTPYTEDATLKFKHAGSSVFVLSNTSAFYANTFLNTEDDATVEAEFTFNTLPKSGAGDPVDGDEFVTKDYVDNLGGGATSYNRTVLTGVAGTTIATGKAVYLDTADQEWKLTDADTIYAKDTQFGIAQGAGSDGDPITNGVLIAGLDTTQTGLTPGASYYLSTTAGSLTATEPANSYFVGVAEAADRLIVDFQKDKTISGTEIVEDNLTQSAKGGVLGEQTTSTNTISLGEVNTTLKKNKLAQKFIPTKTKIRGVELWKKANTGTFTGTATISLRADNAGVPSATVLATVTLTNAQYLALTSDGAFENLFGTEYTTLVIGDTYWIVVESSTSDDSNKPNLGGRTSGGAGNVYYFNTTDGWTQFASSDLYFKIMEGNTNQVVKTGGEGRILNDIIGITFDRFGLLSDKPMQMNATQRASTSTSFVKLKETLLNETMTRLRVKYDARATSSAGTGNYKEVALYIDGVLSGSVENPTNSNVSWSTYTVDFDSGLPSGTLIQVWGRRSGAAFPEIQARSLGIYYSSEIESIGNLVLDTPLVVTDPNPISATNNL